ncbi:MAG: DIP1984 family protein [Oscillospiraceae bacterium]|nr:DIP1984 family protein [Oscillospiraceae bacterium]
MKLAEALQERADLQRKIEELAVRIEDNAIVQEGEKTVEDPKELMRELDASLDRLEEITARINLANCSTKVGDLTLTELIAKKDKLRKKIELYRRITTAGSQTVTRATRTEIKILSAIEVKSLQKTADAISKELRETDNLIQATNWTQEL